MRRKNNPRKGEKKSTISYTLQWVVYGKKSVMSLGPAATLAYAKRIAAEKEKEINSESPSDRLEPIAWSDFKIKYLDTFFRATTSRSRSESRCRPTGARASRPCDPSG